MRTVAHLLGAPCRWANCVEVRRCTSAPSSIGARTQNIVRTVIATPDGFAVAEAEDEEEGLQELLDPQRDDRRQQRPLKRQMFWADFLATLRLDDPEQMLPTPSKAGHVVFRFGPQNGLCWLSAYRAASSNTVGVFLSATAGTIGERIMGLLACQAAALREELPGATIDFSGDRPVISQSYAVSDIDDPASRTEAIVWLQERTNAFINALRPRVRSA